MILLRIVLWISRAKLWITLWITHLFHVYLSAMKRSFSGSPTRKQTELFRLLSADFSSSYINYYYLTYIHVCINRLSSSSLKAFNRIRRNFSAFHPFWSFVLLFLGSKNVKLKDFSRPSASPRPANPAINPLIESFSKTNLPISGVYSWLQNPCRKAARLSLLPSPPPPNPRDMQAIRSLGRVSYVLHHHTLCNIYSFLYEDPPERSSILNKPERLCA